MEKHCESKERFGKEGKATAARNEILESFIRDSGDKAHRFAYRLAGNEQDAGELVQEALYRVARAWGRYEQMKPLDSWFFTVLRNAFIDTRRSSERRTDSLDRPLAGADGPCLADALADGAEGVLSRLERQEAVTTVRRALTGLNAAERAVLKLRDMEGRTYDDVARSLGVRVGTVRSRIFRARQSLRNQSPELAALAR